MKILVTGGAGYIGSHTIIEMYEYQHFNPISIDNYSNSSADVYDRIEKICLKSTPHFTVDVCNLHDLRTVFKQNPDIKGVIHFAALKSVGESVENPLQYYHNNLTSLTNILSCIKEFNIPYFIFSSSCSIYGNIEKLPVQEDSSTSPLSPYAHTKNMGEQIIQDFYKQASNQSCVMLRYFNPVGAHVSGLNGELPSQRPNNLVPVICQAAAGIIQEMEVFGGDYATRDGSCIRDYIHVSDIADAHVQALEYLKNHKNSKNCSVFNLGTGNGVSVFEMIQAFEKINHVKVPYKISPKREGDVEAIYSDSTLAKKHLNWTPKRSLEDMMLSAWLWQKNQPSA